MRWIRRNSVLPKLVRLGAFLFFVQTLGTLLMVRAVRAEVQDLMLSVGSQMMQLGERVGHSQPRTIRLNGAQVRLRVEHSPTLTLAQVLDLFEKRCREHNGRFYEQLEEQRSERALSDAQLDVLDGVMRVESERAGSVACFDVGDERGSPSTLLARAQAFAETGDAASFGQLRYVRAEARKQGVMVVMMWTDGALNVRQMFPAVGDAPGVDFADLPRPPNSRRIFSAWEEGQAPAINIYESSQRAPGELDAFYREQLPKHGWEPMTPPARPGSATHGMLAMRDGVTVTLAQSSLDDGMRGMTTIIPMDRAGATDVRAR